METNWIKCGDCMDILPTLPDKSVDVVFTSPPYNRKRNDKYQFYDDTIEDYFKFLCAVTDECLRLCRKYVVLNIQKNYYNKQDVFKYIGEYAEKIIEIVVWEKTNPLPASGKSITNAYEFFLFIGNDDSMLKSNSTYTKNIIHSSVNNDTQRDHKAVMKKSVCDWFIDNFTEQNDIVLDPFLGTGTTAVSCAERNRKYIGIEITEKYFNEASERLNAIANTPSNMIANKRQISMFEQVNMLDCG